MDEPYQEKHGAFLLKCAPLRAVDGRYVPRLVATRLDRTGSHDIEVALPTIEPFATISMAADYALAFGKRWLRDQLLRPSGFN